MTTGEPANTLSGRMFFLARDPKYQHEKPYTLRYTPAPSDGFQQTNIDKTIHEIRFRDLREHTHLVYNECGFVVTPCSSLMDVPDYDDPAKIETVHAAEVAEAVCKALGAKGARMLDYVVRRRHPTWPISTGGTYQWNQPASRAHIGKFSSSPLSWLGVDHTYEGCRSIIREAFGDEADFVLQKQWQCVNVWHPLRGPLVDWPLALCDARTVDFASDTMAGDVVDRAHVFENTQVHFNPAQKWYYLSNQLPTELIIFKNGDSREPDGATPGVPHASFDNPLTTDNDFKRESIEMRILVLW